MVLEALLARIRAAAPSEAFVSLMPDPLGRLLYCKYGFAEDRDGSMACPSGCGSHDTRAVDRSPRSRPPTFREVALGVSRD
jgi:hypothetical protein